MKFVVIASDVVYPLGEMQDYEANFYLPLKGVEKPVFAIPGNHDWFNALDGFAANLMDPVTARAAIDARVKADLSLSSTTGRSDRSPDRRRRAFAIALPVARPASSTAPFFELHAGDFSLIAIDTGIERGSTTSNSRGCNAALDRSRGTFTMAIVGHPFYAAGRSQIGDGSFKDVHDLLRAHGVRVMMAGDTHDFEYYRDARSAIALFRERRRRRVLEHRDRARLARIGPRWRRLRVLSADRRRSRRSLNAETPWWKWPAWWWIRRFGAWPFSVEALSAVFDFNRAPFFQSFVEVRVERSARPGGVCPDRRRRSVALARPADRRRGRRLLAHSTRPWSSSCRCN